MLSITNTANFNSIKVQLRQTAVFLDLCFERFQFHKGTIKTITANASTAKKVYFNSIKVQLRQELITPHNYRR